MASLSKAETLALKVALYHASRAEGVPLVKGFRCYRRTRSGKVTSVRSVGVYAREQIRRYRAHKGHAGPGVFDATVRELLAPHMPKPPAPAPAAGPCRGLDLSNVNPSASFSLAAKSGVRFAYLKATEGHTFKDATYASRRAQANANGIRVGAYHFARPVAMPGDGAAQARIFLAFAKPSRGDLFPALDLEVNGGMAPAALAEWVREFADEVKRQVGGCVFYTYPAFAAGALAGHSFPDLPLWLAEYGVDAPAVPHGWSDYAVWQQTSNGAVPGLPFRVDCDYAPRGVDHLVIG